jgi:hypothetical protein
VPFPHDEAVKNKVFPPGPRKPRFIVTRAVVSPWTVTFVFLLGLALLILGNGLNAAYGVRGVPVDVMGDFGVALATGAVLFVLERNFFVSKRQDKRAKFDIGPLLDEALEELRQRLEPTPSQLHLACFATVRKGLFTLEQEVYRFMPDGDNGWPQSLELGQGPIGSAVLEQRTLAVDVDGWRWCIVPFVGRTRAGCLMAAIPHTDVKNSVTQTCWSSLSDFSELAASIIEPVVV